MKYRVTKPKRRTEFARNAEAGFSWQNIKTDFLAETAVILK